MDSGNEIPKGVLWSPFRICSSPFKSSHLTTALVNFARRHWQAVKVNLAIFSETSIPAKMSRSQPSLLLRAMSFRISKWSEILQNHCRDWFRQLNGYAFLAWARLMPPGMGQTWRLSHCGWGPEAPPGPTRRRSGLWVPVSVTLWPVLRLIMMLCGEFELLRVKRDIASEKT